MNPEIAQLARHFQHHQKLLLPMPPWPCLSSPDNNNNNHEWPPEWVIYVLSIRVPRERAFLQRLHPSAACVAHVFHGVQGVPNHQQRRRRNRQRQRPQLRPGEIGCDASHRKMWQHIVVSSASSSNSPIILCEDDVNLRGDATQVAYLKLLVHEAATLSIDLVYLAWYQGYPARNPPKQLSEHLRAPFGDYLQLWCLYVTPLGLKKLTQEFPVNQKPILPIDVALRRSKTLRAAVAWPALAWVVGAGSDTAH